jgi:hypothetical protein
VEVSRTGTNKIGTTGSTINRQGYEDNRIMARSVNAQIKSLAPVLNAPTVTSGTSTSGPIRAMTVFAGSAGNAGIGTVNIPCVGGATATRLGETGTVPVTNGSFSDSFADKNAIHIYGIDGGSACGL